MQIELRQREEMRGPAADGLLLGLWIGEVFGAAEYWLVRGVTAAVTTLERVARRPLLAGVASALVGVGILTLVPNRHLDAARAASSLMDEKAIANSAALFRSETAHWPARLEQLVPNYLKELRVDPWGHNYALFRGEGGLAIVSAGPDGEIGTPDDKQLIVDNRAVTCPDWCGTSWTLRSRDDLPFDQALGCPLWTLDEAKHGMRISKLGPGALSAVGFERNDVITKVEGKPVASFLDAYDALRAMSESTAADVSLEVLRGESQILFAIDRAHFKSLMKRH
ncbi:MAG TPA: type II secretion system protein GspG [Myxococcales bacterium]|nr:type II secretion system protein GspG [Myxococcales bacterium]